jgi:hypothetical protein
MKYWEIIANRLSKAGWSLGWVSAIDSEGRTIWIADAHCDNGKRFVVHADDILTAFLELEETISVCDQLCLTSSFHGLGAPRYRLSRYCENTWKRKAEKQNF